MRLKNMVALSLALLLLFSLALVSPIEASSGDNKLTVYKIVNDNKAKIAYFRNGEGHTLAEIPNKGEAVVGSPLQIYRVPKGEETKEWDEKSIDELGIPFQKAVTDLEGRVVFPHLPDGQYYLRDLSPSGYLAQSFMVRLPEHQDNGVLRQVTRHSKVGRPGGSGGSSGDDKTSTPDPTGDEPSSPADEPDVISPVEDSFKQVFVKVDDSKPAKPLAGSKFKVVQLEENAETNSYKPVRKEGHEYILVSGADGQFEVSGIPAGVYYLVETEAPAVAGKKYKLLNQPHRFELKTTVGVNQPIYIRNMPLIETTTNASGERPSSSGTSGSGKVPGLPKTLPKTGDLGFILFLLAGGGVFVFGMRIYQSDSRQYKLWR